MKRKYKRRLVALTMTGAVGLGVGLTYMASLPVQVHADDVPQSVDVKKATAGDKDFSYSYGYRTKADSGLGAHFVDRIKDTAGNDLFCVQWSKNAPSDTRIAAKVQAEPAVTWLVNNYYKGASKRFATLGKGDEGDYWLYQSVIHWITEPNDTDTANGYNIQHYMNNPAIVAPAVKAKLQALYDEANKQAKAGTTEEVLNTHAMSFDPTKLAMNSSDLSGDSYHKNFTFKSTNMKNVKIWLDGQPTGTKISGSGVDLNNVRNNAKINVNMPYKDVTTAAKTFHVKAKGDWNKQMRVAYIYGDTKNTNQNIAKQVVKATTVPLNVTANMDVTVSPALGQITFTKKGSANNNRQILAGTKFKLTGGSVVQEATADQNGKVDFKSLPLGLTYKIDEVAQPNKYYTTDLSKYSTTVTALSGSNPSLTATAWGGTLVNTATHHDFSITKLNANSGKVAGAQFVLVQVNKGAGLKVASPAEAKAKAMYQSGEYIVAGNNNGKPVIATGDSNGVAKFKLVATDPSKFDYYAVEVKAPSGYQLALAPTKLSVDNQGANELQATVKDDVKPTLPETGSREEMYYLMGAGGLLMVAFGGAVHKLKEVKD